MINNLIGYAIRFQETKDTFSHLDVLREEGQVLWGAWRKPGSVSLFSKSTKEQINSSDGVDYYAIGQTTVWKMHVIQCLSTDEVTEQELDYLIPAYYNIDTEVYCWYLIDDIKDYGNRNCLSILHSSSGKTLENVHQIPGNNPWKVYSAPTDVEKYVPNVIPRTVNPYAKERGKLTAGMRYDILRRDGFKCKICGRSAEDGVKLHVDHIIPVSKGGKTEWDNLRTLCQDCNLGKSNKIE